MFKRVVDIVFNAMLAQVLMLLVIVAIGMYGSRPLSIGTVFLSAAIAIITTVVIVVVFEFILAKIKND